MSTPIGFVVAVPYPEVFETFTDFRKQLLSACGVVDDGWKECVDDSGKEWRLYDVTDAQVNRETVDALFAENAELLAANGVLWGWGQYLCGFMAAHGMAYKDSENAVP